MFVHLHDNLVSASRGRDNKLLKPTEKNNNETNFASGIELTGISISLLTQRSTFEPCLETIPALLQPVQLPLLPVEAAVALRSGAGRAGAPRGVGGP